MEKALENLRSLSVEDFRENCYESYKDFYGVRGHHVSGWSKEDCLDFWLSHYEWDESQRAWTFARGSVLDEETPE